MKKLLVVALGVAFLVGGCGKATMEPEVTREIGDTDAVAEINSGIAKLKDNTDYLISSMVDDASGTTYNLDVVHEDVCYTEYPYDPDTQEVGTLDYGSSAEMQYSLNEYTDSDNKVYAFGNDGVYYMPDAYYDFVKGRPSLYVDELLPEAYDVRKEKSFELDVAGKSEKFQGFSFKVPAEVAKKIYGASSYGVYTSIKTEHEGDNIGKLCDFYLEGINFELACSDANVFVGLDIDGVLRYMCLEIGGAGTRSYLTKIVVGFENSNVREAPDFSEAEDFSVTLNDLADFVSSYDTYDDALDALSEMDSNLSTDTGVDEAPVDAEESDNDSAVGVSDGVGTTASEAPSDATDIESGDTEADVKE